MTSIVFSKDRALQLHAFLRSYYDHVSPVETLHVLYTASSPRHERAYQELFAHFKQWVVPHRETAFRQDVLDLIPTTGCCILFVDDQVFIRPWNVEELPGLSLRHGSHLTYNYSTDAKQLFPPMQKLAGDKLTWKWAEGELDWGYPLSVDGHVYALPELNQLLEQIDFSSPNSLESNLQRFVPLFLPRHGICYLESKAVSIPWNRVQSSHPNRHAGNLNSEQLLDAWENGQQINVRSLYGVKNISVHQDFPLILEPQPLNEFQCS